MEILFFTIEFALFAAAVALIIYGVKGETSMKKKIIKLLYSSVGSGIAMAIIVGLILVAGYALSWIAT